VGAELLSAYAELHLHTNYSLLDGASHPEELIERARELGYRSLAITDHDNLFGAMVFARLCKEASIQPITGVELTLADDEHCLGQRHHLTLLAANRRGYGNLCPWSAWRTGWISASRTSANAGAETPACRWPGWPGTAPAWSA